MRLTPALAPCCIVLSLGLPTLRAQEAAPDSTPFHRGQWAGQFSAGLTFLSAGVLYFRSPRGAWLLDASGNYSSASFRSTDTLIYGNSGSAGGGTIRVGWRGYRPIAASTLFFHTFGVVLRGGGGRSSYPTSYQDQWSWGAGAFGELGADYMITPHISVGAAAGLSVVYGETHFTTSSSAASTTTKSTDSIVSVNVSLLSLVLAVYF